MLFWKYFAFSFCLSSVGMIPFQCSASMPLSSSTTENQFRVNCSWKVSVVQKQGIFLAEISSSIFSSKSEPTNFNTTALKGVLSAKPWNILFYVYSAKNGRPNSANCWFLNKIKNYSLHYSKRYGKESQFYSSTMPLPICFAQMFVMVLAKQNRWSLGFKLLQTIFGGVSQIIQHLFINTNCILRAYKSYDVVQCAQETP